MSYTETLEREDLGYVEVNVVDQSFIDLGTTKFRIVDILGHGNFGHVYKAVEIGPSNQRQKEEVAIKTVELPPREDDRVSFEEKEDIMKEDTSFRDGDSQSQRNRKRLLRTIKTEFLVSRYMERETDVCSFAAVCATALYYERMTSRVVLVLPLGYPLTVKKYFQKTFHPFLQKKKTSPSWMIPFASPDMNISLTVAKLAQELFRALSVLHRVGVAHGDVKDDNILLSTKDNFSARFIDLAFSCVKDAKNDFIDCSDETPPGAQPYIDRDLYFDTGFKNVFERKKLQDVYALGLTLVQMVDPTFLPKRTEVFNPIEKKKKWALRFGTTEDINENLQSVSFLDVRVREIVTELYGPYQKRNSSPYYYGKFSSLVKILSLELSENN